MVHEIKFKWAFASNQILILFLSKNFFFTNYFNIEFAIIIEIKKEKKSFHILTLGDGL